MDQEQLLKRVDGRWLEFKKACRGLSEAALQEPGVIGEWSVRDLMDHLANWEEETVAALDLIMEGKHPVRYAALGGIDAFNDSRWRGHWCMTTLEVEYRSADVHARLMAFLAKVSVRHFATETRFRHRLRLDTYGHYPEHGGQVVAWRKSKDL